MSTTESLFEDLGFSRPEARVIALKMFFVKKIIEYSKGMNERSFHACHQKSFYKELREILLIHCRHPRWGQGPSLGAIQKS